MRKRVINGEKGMTLIEVLVSIVILGIVIVSFMSFFPQMAGFNLQTKTKLETMNDAKILLDDAKGQSYKLTHFSSANGYVAENGFWLKYVPDKRSKDKVVYKVNQTPSLKPAGENLGDQVTLHEIHIMVLKNDQVSSETFGYIEVME